MSFRTEDLVLDSLAADPGSTEDGQVWYNTTTKKVRFRSNAVTKSLGQPPFNERVYTVDPTDPTADYAGAETAIAAATAGDVVLLCPGNHTIAAPITIPNGVRVQGVGGRYGNPRTVLTMTTNGTVQMITSAGTAVLADLDIQMYDAGSVVALVALYVTGGNCYLERCRVAIDTTGALSGSANVIQCSGGNVQLIQSEVYLLDGALVLSTRRGAYVSLGNSLTAWDTEFSAIAGQSIALNHASATVKLTGCKVNDTFLVTAASAVSLYGSNYIQTISDAGNKITIYEADPTNYAQKTAPVAADRFLIADSADSNKSKRLQLGNLVAYKMRDTGGPADLALDSIPDGQYLRRSGATIIGATPAGTADLLPSKRAPTASQLIPAGTGLVIPGKYEILAGLYLEIGADASLEIC